MLLLLLPMLLSAVGFSMTVFATTTAVAVKELTIFGLVVGLPALLTVLIATVLVLTFALAGGLATFASFAILASILATVLGHNADVHRVVCGVGLAPEPVPVAKVGVDLKVTGDVPVELLERVGFSLCVEL